MDPDYNRYGRAAIENNRTSTQIIIPVKKKDWVQPAGSIIILCLFIVVESSAIYFHATGFYLFFPVPAILMSMLVLKSLVWELFGKEIIIVNRDQLYIEKKNRLFNKPTIYEVRNIKDIELRDDSMIYKLGSGLLENDRLWDTGGIIRFKYNNKEIRFGTDLTELEAANIVALLKERHFLSNENLGKSKYTDWWRSKGDG